MRNMTMLDRRNTLASSEECPNLPPKSNKGWGRAPHTGFKTLMRVIRESVSSLKAVSSIVQTSRVEARLLDNDEDDMLHSYPTEQVNHSFIGRASGSRRHAAKALMASEDSSGADGHRARVRSRLTRLGAILALVATIVTAAPAPNALAAATTGSYWAYGVTCQLHPSGYGQIHTVYLGAVTYPNQTNSTDSGLVHLRVERRTVGFLGQNWFTAWNDFPMYLTAVDNAKKDQWFEYKNGQYFGPSTAVQFMDMDNFQNVYRVWLRWRQPNGTWSGWLTYDVGGCGW